MSVLDIPADRVLYKRRLEPGRMFLVDTKLGRIIADEELKLGMAQVHPYREWLNENLKTIDELDTAPKLPKAERASLLQRQHVFGYTFETLRTLLIPMAKNGVEALGAMGDDTPVAVLSDQPQMLYNYFRQLFAQVTNPPLDGISEELVTASDVVMGTEQNILEIKPENCRQIKLKNPILSNADLAGGSATSASRALNPKHCRCCSKLAMASLVWKKHWTICSRRPMRRLKMASTSLFFRSRHHE